MKFPLLVLSVFAAIHSFCFATLRLQPCQFGLEGELLYFAPSLDDELIAEQILKQNSGIRRDLILNPDYKPGFRVEGLWAFDSLYDLHARFTYFNSNRNRRDLTGFFDSDFSSEDEFIQLSYNRAYKIICGELLLGRWLYDCDDFDLSIQGGLLYSYRRIKTRQESNLLQLPSPPFTQFRQRRDDLKFWGIGPEFVFDFQYHFPACRWGLFSLAGEARGALLATQRKKNRSSTVLVVDPNGQANRNTIIVRDETRYNVYPAFDLRGGLNWSLLCGCTWEIELGYEWLFYTQDISDNQSLSLQGPYLELGIAF